ncbi:hypothetical protein V493_01776 [Pseudogymnoascus sp. VKM F-4281 (FW-2241)]|nr:hypothetical protein V493_01776 [Pseudogymnoascus sp. VKM F-4281 (FW-2241)]
MSDPLSVAGSVAGLISLGAATTKLVYQFVSSIRDAPKDVKAITRSLYGVNIALCQVQTLLLDLTYASETSTEDLGDLEQSVVCCVASFNVIENWLREVCSGITEDQLTTRRAWQQVKCVFQKESLKEALKRLENEKGSLQLIISVLNSKSMAQVLSVVKNAERVAAQQNTQVIKRLDLIITRQIHDAIGRSHTTTSSISLDSFCTQNEIERLLMDNGSALSLTVADVSDDGASIIFIPDSLSRVETSTCRIEFQSVEDDTKAVKYRQDTESKKHDGVPISAARVQRSEGLSISRNIIDAIKTIRLTTVEKEINAKGSVGSSVFDVVFRGNMFAPGNLATTISKLLTDRSIVEKTNLENAIRCIERFEFYSSSFMGPGAPGIKDRHVLKCFQNAQDAIEQYGAFVQKVYGGTDGNSKPTRLFQTNQQQSSTQFHDLWLKVDFTMSDLAHIVKFHIMVEQRQLLQSLITAQQEKGIYPQLQGTQMQKSLDEKVEFTHQPLETAIVKMEGGLDTGNPIWVEGTRGDELVVGCGEIKAGPGLEVKERMDGNG